MRLALNFAAGLIFGIGLILSQMVNPAKVMNFLDVAGTWDPSLAFVMGGAVTVAFFGYRVALARPAPLCGETFHLPTAQGLDARLFVGPAIFGVGWGLAGLCPGPAVTALAVGGLDVALFVAFMLAGMWAARMIAQGGVGRPARA
jgi:uncharacterized membrane protein YedE/YeeE